MTRKEFIDRIIAIYRLKYKPSDLEIDEFRLVLELMPDSDKSSLTVPTSPLTIPDTTPSNPNPWWKDTVVMYGCPMPNSWDFNKSNSTSTFDNPIEGLKLKDDKKE